MVLRAETEMSDKTTKPRERWHGIIGTGQSLSVGFQAWMDGTTPAAQGGLRLHDATNTYDWSKPEADCLRIVPFTEPFRPQTQSPDTYPGNINGKTPQHSMTMQIAKLCADNGVECPVTVHTAVGKNGAPLFEIKKDGTRNAYEASIYEASALSRLAHKHGAKLVYTASDAGAIVLTHGEADALLGHETYAEELIKFREDYVKDLASLTSSDDEQDTTDKKNNSGPVLILSQQQSFPTILNIQSQLIHDQWYVQRMSDDRILCACPKYQFGYAPGGVHLPLGGYDRLGEKYGQVYFHTVLQQEPWQPLSPSRIVLSSPTTISVRFRVMYPPLQWDEYLPKPHAMAHTAWRHGRGFEVRDREGAELEIAKVKIDDDGANSVTVTLAQPAPRERLPLQLSYAMVPDVEGHGAAGEPDGRMGLLRDSDPTWSVGAAAKRVVVKHGHAEITCADGWDSQALYDLLEDLQSGEVYVLQHLFPEDADRRTLAVLDRPWSGASSAGEETEHTTTVRCRHNLYNYCVTFAMPVAYPFAEKRDVFDEIDKEVMEKWRGFQVNSYDECRRKLVL